MSCSTDDAAMSCCSKVSAHIMQEQKKKELEELNTMLAEMGVAPKESDSETAGTAPAGKKKKRKDKAAVKDSSATIVNGNGVAPAEQLKAEEPTSEQPQQESVEVLLNTSCLHNCLLVAACTFVMFMVQLHATAPLAAATFIGALLISAAVSLVLWLLTLVPCHQ